MMNKISTRIVSDRSYETDYEDFYEADHEITMVEANDLILADYHRFPITKAVASIDGNTVAIRYTVDCCD